MPQLNEDTWIEVCEFLGPLDILNLLLSISTFFAIFSNSLTLLRKFTLIVDKDSFPIISSCQKLLDTKIRNICINCYQFDTKIVPQFLKNYEKSVEKLILINIDNGGIIFNYLHDLRTLQSLILENCYFDKHNVIILPFMMSLKSISFHNCNENCFKMFKNQKNIEKVTICCYTYTFTGFAHEEFNDLVENFPNFYHLVLDGDATSSYFDIYEFPFKIKILETTSITFHWYVGLRTPRIDFLNSQLGSLKELTIHKLPNDFDGDQVLKFIIEEMQLIKFFYGKIPLILNGTKQDVQYFSATEIQIKSSFEMFRQFRSIKKFRLILNNTDICSDAVENVVNPKTDLFANLNEFELVDKSKFRGLLGVFLGFYKNLTNIKKLTLDTLDRNINVILEECLPYMRKLEEITLTSTQPNAESRFEVIKRFAKGLKKLVVPANFVPIAKSIFDCRVSIEGIKIL
ncbi:uncharacterized protein [Chironomus tepperi]|uniref:uncharacterized protein n=1 Tax=Chironomus tepperi TaxID=113505 RepID=UPI00391F00E7